MEGDLSCESMTDSGIGFLACFDPNIARSRLVVVESAPSDTLLAGARWGKK
jgi:hypothetical protein